MQEYLYNFPGLKEEIHDREVLSSNPARCCSDIFKNNMFFNWTVGLIRPLCPLCQNI